MMTPDEIKKKREEGWNAAWYTSRVLVGMFIHIVLVLSVLTSVEHAFSFLEMNAHTTDPISHAYSRQAHYLIALTVFTAGMAGVSWVKSLYIRHFLPEVLDDITKKIIK
jgi:hypothetical protein